MATYMQFGTAPGPFLTQEVPRRIKDAANMDGMTAYQVHYEGRWRRVYQRDDSSTFVNVNGEQVAVAFNPAL